MNDDILIINGKKYVHTPEVKEKKQERLERFVDNYTVEITGVGFANNAFRIKPKYRDTTRMVELKEDEIIVSEDEVMNAWRKSGYIQVDVKLFLKCLGFKKDGV